MLPLFFFVAAAVAAEEPNWPQWRGPHRNGVSSETGLPLEWSATENVLWKTAIEGRGHSSPVVWGDRVFVTADIEGETIEGASAPKHVRDGEVYLHPDSQSGDRRHTLKVVALDAESGAILWSRTAHDGRVFDNRHRVNTYASPTAVADGERVYVYFGSEGLLAYDFEGTLVWSKDLGDAGRERHHGVRRLRLSGQAHAGDPNPASRSGISSRFVGVQEGKRIHAVAASVRRLLLLSYRTKASSLASTPKPGAWSTRAGGFPCRASCGPRPSRGTRRSSSRENKEIWSWSRRGRSTKCSR